MAIAFDAASNSGYQSPFDNYSWNHTCTGASLFLAVDIAISSDGVTVSSLTYNSVPLTLIVARSTVDALGRVECWGLANPSSGVNGISLVLSGSAASVGMSVSYTGVHQTSPTEGAASTQATNVGAADATVDVTSTADQCWIHAALLTNDGSVTAGQTARNAVNPGTHADEDFGPQSPGTKVMNYTGLGAGVVWAMAGYAIRPTSASASEAQAVFASTGFPIRKPKYLSY